MGFIGETQVALTFELVTHETPLAVAAEQGHLKVVTFLLAARLGPGFLPIQN